MELLKHAEPIIVVDHDGPQTPVFVEAPKPILKKACWQDEDNGDSDVEVVENTPYDEDENPQHPLPFDVRRRNALGWGAAAHAVDPRPVDDINPGEMSPGECTDKFWELIAKFAWQNASDQNMNHRTIQQTFARFTGGEKEVFLAKYNTLYEEMHARLTADGVFARRGMDGISDQARVVSHFIAMGRDVYSNLIETREFCEFLIDNGDCQSLDEMLPFEYQH